MIYLFLKADEYLLADRLAAFKSQMGDAETADLNITELEGTGTSAGDILYHASTLAFLAERRLVIVRGYLGHLDRRMGASKGTENAAYDEAARLIAGLATLPATNDVAFVEQDLDKRRHLWRGFSRPEGDVPGISQLIQEKRLLLEELGTPEARELPGWIARLAKDEGFSIQRQAVQMLADYIGPDLRRLHNEIRKLAAYAEDRAIGADDVELLVSDASQALIWDLTDALSARDGRKAMHTLHALRRGDANPFYLLTMIARQYRIMIKVKDALGQGGGSEYDIARRVGESPYPVKKAMGQSRAYPMAELMAIMDRLLGADHAMKTGADPDTELDVLVAELTQRSSR